MRWWWRRDAEDARAERERAERQLREVRGRWPEIRETVHTLRAALDSTTGDDPFIEGVRREFGRHA